MLKKIDDTNIGAITKTETAIKRLQEKREIVEEKKNRLLSGKLINSSDNRIEYTSDYDEGEVVLPGFSDRIFCKNELKMSGGRFSML